MYFGVGFETPSKMIKKAIIILLSIATIVYGHGSYKIRGDYENKKGNILLSDDEKELVFYNLDTVYVDDGNDANTVSFRASESMNVTYYMRLPVNWGDPNSVLTTEGIQNAQLRWDTFDANWIVHDGNEFTFPTKTPWCVIFVDANGYPLTDDPNNFTYYEPNTAFGVGLDNIAEGTYANNYIQVYTLLDFHPTLFNTTIGMGSDDVTTGPNNVRIGHGAGDALDEGYENTLGGKDAGTYLIDSNDNTGWGYKVIGGNATLIPDVVGTYTMTYFSESQYIYGVPLNDGTITSLDVGGVARNVGGGVVGLPFADHPFLVGDTVDISGTGNYNADEVLLAGTTEDELQITAAYVAETFDGTETIIKQITDSHSGCGRMAMDSTGNIYYGIDWDKVNGTSIIKIKPDGTLVYDSLTWPITSVNCLSLIITPDDKYLYFLSTGTTIIKFDLATGISEWTVTGNSVDYEIAIDADDNLYVSKGSPGSITKLDAADGTATVLTSMGIPTLYPTVLGGLVYDVIVDDDLDIVIGGGYMACLATASEATKATMYNLGVRTLDNSKGATVRLGDLYTKSGMTYTRDVGTGNIAIYDGYIYVIVPQAAASTIYKLQWDGTTLNSILSFAGPAYGTGLYFDLWNNLVVVNQDSTGGQIDILYYYDTDGNYITKINNMAGAMLATWSSPAGSSFLQGDVVFNGVLEVPGGPDVHRVTALGAYAATLVTGGADDGLYLGTYSGAHNTTDPNRFFLDNLDRGTYLGEKGHGMMYGYFAEDPNDQWLIINADVNMPQDVDVNSLTVDDLTINDLTASRLVSTNASKVLASTNLNLWVTGVADETDIADDGDGTITIGIVDPVIVGKGGTGAATFTDGGVLLGSGTSAFTPMAVLADGEFIVGDGTTDPVAESGNTARTSLGLGTGDSPTFVKTTLTGNEINIATAQTPASAAAAGTQGDIAWDSGYVYVCVADNTWKRSALTSWGLPQENVTYAGENVIYAAEQVVYP